MPHRHQTFGRRGAITAPPARTPTPAAPPVPETPPPPASGWIDHRDEELEAWMRARKWNLPWRQISLMASLCFGIASFVLPDSVNKDVNWLLYALMAASFIAGLRMRAARKG